MAVGQKRILDRDLIYLGSSDEDEENEATSSEIQPPSSSQSSRVHVNPLATTSRLSEQSNGTLTYETVPRGINIRVANNSDGATVNGIVQEGSETPLITSSYSLSDLNSGEIPPVIPFAKVQGGLGGSTFTHSFQQDLPTELSGVVYFDVDANTFYELIKDPNSNSKMILKAIGLKTSIGKMPIKPLKIPSPMKDMEEPYSSSSQSQMFKRKKVGLRAGHETSERIRRSEMRRLYDQLREVVIPPNPMGGLKASKIATLNGAIKCVKELQETGLKLEQEEKVLNYKKWTLEKLLKSKMSSSELLESNPNS